MQQPVGRDSREIKERRSTHSLTALVSTKSGFGDGKKKSGEMRFSWSVAVACEEERGGRVGEKM